MLFSFPAPSVTDTASLFRQGKGNQGVVVLSYDSEADLQNGYIIYRGGVTATYGATVLKADTLIVRKGSSEDPAVSVKEGTTEISLRPMEAYAIGSVNVVDPDGTVQATNLWFTWDPKRRANRTEVVGKADKVIVQMGTAHITADSMAISDEGYDFRSVALHIGDWNPPLYEIDAISMFITPGKKGVAKGVRLSLLGAQLPRIPSYSFSLDPRQEGIQVPRLGIREGAGVGVSWNTSFPVTHDKSLTASFNAYPNVLPYYSIAYVKSNIHEEEAGINQFRLTDTFGDRSNFTFFGNVYTKRIEDAYEGMRVPKDTFSIGSSFNNETFGRRTDRITNYSKAIEVGYEKGGPIGGWAYLLQAKAARISEIGNGSATRLTFSGSTFMPLAKSGRFTASTRFDGTLRVDPSSSGFLGGEAGVSYELRENLRVSSGVYGYKHFGTPYFNGDNFITNQGYVVRGDWFGGSTNISLMFRYDPTQGWFDREYRVTQVIGPIEPVLTFRESPRQYQFGIRFRVQDLAKMLQRKKIQRSHESKPGNPK